MLTAPKIKHYIEHNQGYTGITMTQENCRQIDDVFKVMHRIKAQGEDELRSVWISAKRGPISDFGDFEDWKDEYIQTEEDFEREWKSWFPAEEYWYLVQTVEHKDRFRALFINHTLVFQTLRSYDRRGWPWECEDLIKWLEQSLNDSIDKVQNGTYEKEVIAHIPPERRYGLIPRKDVWEIIPEWKENELAGMTGESIKELEELVVKQRTFKRKTPWGETYVPDAAISQMTGNDFLRYCKIGYEACGYDIPEGIPLYDLYLKYADGRDSGLGMIDLDSADAFKEWLNNREKGGHPWEVCRGGNSTHVSLFVAEKEDGGYYLICDGNAWNRAAETSKFFIALSKAGLPVILRDAEAILARFKGTDKIGIVPDMIFPAYCERHFIPDVVLDCVHIPYECTEDETKEFIRRTTWEEPEGGIPEIAE